MHLKVPPVAVLVVAGLLLYAGDRMLPEFGISFPGQTVLAILLIVAGIVPGLQAVTAFARKKTTVNPSTPGNATKLVTEGIYGFSRNPMYLGLLCILLAAAVYSGTLLALIIVPAFVWYMTEYQIKPEEEALEEIFGSAYTDYLSRVRRWI